MHHNSEETQEIVQSLLAVRAKLKRSLVLKTNIMYEVSIRFFLGGGRQGTGRRMSAYVVGWNVYSFRCGVRGLRNGIIKS